ncbi:hypothetical protein BT93_L3605 [Corymbia citriodora subsp. variegata]|uniref:Uncharacterized protein n=1 Tax=Corymbia citriodora subsp. variegata TaxID=360336 RepID=A0A8T0CI39_CORYI|nr:hypothetical protein BT93_L3605 [Corymbia citriodora subsp. variegata]
MNLQIKSTPCDKTKGLILAGKACAYRLVADQVGKFSYQSEFKMQRDEGLDGLIVVSSPDNEHP